jgi:hypothetical protein
MAWHPGQNTPDTKVVIERARVIIERAGDRERARAREQAERAGKRVCIKYLPTLWHNRGLNCCIYAEGKIVCTGFKIIPQHYGEVKSGWGC